jgi:hypothetical protein
MIAIKAQVQLDLKRLAQLPGKVQRKVLKAAVQDGARMVRDRLKATAPRSTDPRLIAGLLQAAQTVKMKTYRSGAVAVAITGPATNMQRDRKTGRRLLSAFGRRVVRKAAKFSGRGRQLSYGAKQSPSAYAHLAGPGRKQRYATDVARDLSGPQKLMQDRIAQGVEQEANSA